jgi:hypothetical protein
LGAGGPEFKSPRPDHPLLLPPAPDFVGISAAGSDARSPRTEQSIRSSCARSSCSGGIDWTAHLGVPRVEPGRELLQHLVHHGPDGPERMVFPHPLLRRQTTEHVILPGIVTWRAPSDAPQDASLDNFCVFQQAVGQRLSEACCEGGNGLRSHSHGAGHFGRPHAIRGIRERPFTASWSSSRVAVSSALNVYRLLCSATSESLLR